MEGMGKEQDVDDQEKKNVWMADLPEHYQMIESETTVSDFNSWYYYYPIGFKNRGISYPKCISSSSERDWFWFLICYIFIETVSVPASWNNALSLIIFHLPHYLGQVLA